VVKWVEAWKPQCQQQVEVVFLLSQVVQRRLKVQLRQLHQKVRLLKVDLHLLNK
jgi:hypothetical protein